MKHYKFAIVMELELFKIIAKLNFFLNDVEHGLCLPLSLEIDEQVQNIRDDIAKLNLLVKLHFDSLTKLEIEMVIVVAQEINEQIQNLRLREIRHDHHII